MVEKVSGAITAQEIAEKDVMTARTQSGTREEPVPAERRTQEVLNQAQVASLARMGMQIEELYGQPMDIEWVLHDGRFSSCRPDRSPLCTRRYQRWRSGTTA